MKWGPVEPFDQRLKYRVSFCQEETQKGKDSHNERTVNGCHTQLQLTRALAVEGSRSSVMNGNNDNLTVIKV